MNDLPVVVFKAATQEQIAKRPRPKNSNDFGSFSEVQMRMVVLRWKPYIDAVNDYLHQNLYNHPDYREEFGKVLSEFRERNR
jgi:hypothetical protein